nr:hypothetical protein [bacterium]
KAETLISENKLVKGKFFMNWGRIASSKNIPGQVIILGELRKQFPGLYDDFKIVIIGGNPQNPDPGEIKVMDKVQTVADMYGLRIGKNGQIVRIESQQPPVIAAMYLSAFAHLGTQHYEQFGMAVAEASAVKAKAFVAISDKAGFATWGRENGYGSDFVSLDLSSNGKSGGYDIAKYAEAARMIHEFSQKTDLRDSISRMADLANKELRWKSLAEHMREELKLANEREKARAERGIIRDSSYVAMPSFQEDVINTTNGPLVSEAKGIGHILAGWLKSVKAGLMDDAASKVPEGEEVSWLGELKGGARKLITVAGAQASLLADLIWSMLDSPDLGVPAQRVHRNAFEGNAVVPKSVEQIMETVRTGIVDDNGELQTSLPGFGQSSGRRFGGVAKTKIIQDHVSAVVTEVGAGDPLVGDIHIVVGSNPTPEHAADITVGSGSYFINSAYLQQFMKPVSP